MERSRWNLYLPEIRFRMGNMRCFSRLSPYKVDFVHNAVYQVNQVKRKLYNVSGTEEYLYHSKCSSRKSHQILLFRGHVIGVSTYYLFLVRTAERTTPFASSESVVSDSLICYQYRRGALWTRVAPLIRPILFLRLLLWLQICKWFFFSVISLFVLQSETLKLEI